MLTLTYTQEKQAIFQMTSVKPGKARGGVGGGGMVHGGGAALFTVRDSFTLSGTFDLTDANRILTEEVIARLDAELESLGAPPIRQAPSGAAGPEATASFIVSASTGFFAAYADNHPEFDQRELLHHFMGLIRPAIAEGFRLATEILRSLSLFDENVESGIRETFDLVMEQLDAFEQQQLALLGDGDAAVEVEETEEPEMAAA